MSLVLFPRHPLHMWKYHVTLYHFTSCVPLTRALDSDLQLRKQHGSGLVCCPCCHNWPPFIGSRAQCLFSLHCWKRKMGGTLVYLWVWPLGCMWRKHFLLHTMNWPAHHWPKHQNTGTLDSSCRFPFLNSRLLNPNSHRRIATARRSKYPSWTLMVEHFLNTNRVQLLT